MKFPRRQFLSGAASILAATGIVRAADERIPAYHKDPAKGPLPQTKDPEQYTDKPLVKRVYELASKVRPVLYQMPCYCGCDKFAGHGSLLDCFVDAHGEECSVCQREAVYTYQQNKAGIAVKQIRDGIMAGKWRGVDMSLETLAKI